MSPVTVLHAELRRLVEEAAYKGLADLVQGAARN
jgi:hypothetical protein